jgi:hypothetical protein
VTKELIHPRTRREFRELSSAWGVLRTIADAFEDEGFFPGPEVESGGQRRSLFDTYANMIDWTDSGQVSRAVRVFEEILSWGGDVDPQYRDPTMAKIRRTLLSDGYDVDAQYRIRPKANRTVTELPLEELRDPAAIEEHLRRLDAAGDSDPPLAISSGKALIEATCKHVLAELGEKFDDMADIPALVKAVQKALKVHPDTIAPTAKGRETIVRTLSNLSQVAIGVAELRNEYGPDHGRTRASTGMRPRHAHLAVGAAQTFCRFLLETLRDRRAADSPQ